MARRSTAIGSEMSKAIGLSDRGGRASAVMETRVGGGEKVHRRWFAKALWSIREGMGGVW